MAVKRLLTGLQLGALGVVGARLLPGARRKPALRAPADAASLRLSVVIPARNEADRIAPCLQALQNMYAVDEVIVVDDESTDYTAAVASELGATVVAGAPLPAGWVGKPWALHQGLLATRNDVVVCLDADTVPQNGLMSALCEELEGNDVVTLAPQFLTFSSIEQGLHAAMLAGLVYRFGAVGADNIPSPERVYGNGQCLAFRREWFMREGGFGLVANQMNDDIALLRALASRDARISFRDGHELLKVRMYSSAGEVWNEWGRSLPMVDTTTRLSRWFDIAILWLVLGLPAFRTLGLHANRTDIACLLVRFGMCRAISASYAGSKLGVYLSPLFDIAATARLTQATCVPVRAWRGRQYTQQGSEVRQTS